MKSSTISQKLNLQNIMASLKMLSQQSDQSRQQIFQPCLPDDSNWSNKSSIQKNNSVNKITINCGEAVLGQYCRKQVHSEWSQGLQISQVTQLKQINKKLFQDNKSLIMQCIRLRKMLKDPKINHNKEQQFQIINMIQLQNLEYLNQINKLRIQNLQLRIFSKASQTHSYKDEDKKFIKHLQQLKQNIKQMSAKLEYFIEKDKNNKLSTSNTTTVASRFDQTDKDRVISNIKIVYEDRIKNLQAQIQNNKQEINRLKRFSSLKSY